MRVALVSTLGTPVRSDRRGSIEGIVWLLARELGRLGQEVTVFASGDSEVDGELVAPLPGAYGTNGSPDDWHVCEWINLTEALRQSQRFDVVHSHVYLWGMPFGPLWRAPVAHTLHVTPYEDDATLRSMWPSAHLVAISRYQWSAFRGAEPDAVIYHGVDPTQFTLRREAEDYACYLGRFTPGKGAWHAVQVARRLGMRLLLAGPRNDYYKQKIEPLVDGINVEYVGSVAAAERDRLLGGARVLLYPVQSPEPFGLVPIEAMMCGTPVAAISLGAVPEIVEDGLTGCLAVSAEDLAEQAMRCLALNRAAIRERTVARFSSERMARDHAAFYERIAGGAR